MSQSSDKSGHEAFLGKPIDYWIDMDARLKNKGYEEMAVEIYELRREIKLYRELISMLAELAERNAKNR